MEIVGSSMLENTMIATRGHLAVMYWVFSAVKSIGSERKEMEIKFEKHTTATDCFFNTYSQFLELVKI